MYNNKYQIKSQQHQISNHHKDNKHSHMSTVIFVDKVKPFEELFKGKTLQYSQT
jgi:hypothetical protein